MAEDPTSRRPPRDARLDELLAESRALLRGQDALRAQVRETEVRRAREAPQFKGGERRPVEETRPVERAPTQAGAEQQAVVRTRQDVENELKATQRKFDQYRNELYSQGKVPSRRSSVVRGFESDLSALRAERAGFAAGQAPPADLQKRLELLRQGKSLTGQQTAAEVEQLGVIKQQVSAVEQLRAAQKSPVQGPALATAAEQRGLARQAQIGLESRLANLDALRRQGEASRAAAPQGLILPAPARSSSVGAAVLQGESRRLQLEQEIARARQTSLTNAAQQEATIAAERQAAEAKIFAQRRAEAFEAGTGGSALLGAELNARKIPPAGLYPREGSGQTPRGGVLYYGQPAGDRSGAGPVLRRGYPAPVSGFPGLEGGGVVQNYARSTDQSMAAILGAERTQRSIPAFYQQLQAGSVIQAQASQQMRRHGALTTEFLSALARGETTLAEFRFQIGSTIAKFGGWTIAAASVYGVIGAISTLSRGAKESLSGVQQLNRFITNVDTKEAAKGFRDVSREVNVSIGDVANAQANFLRVYHNQSQSLEAGRTALKLTKLDNVSTADSLRYLTASAQEFQLPASKIVVLGDKLANVFRTMGVPIQESLPAFARSAAAVKNAGGDLTQLIELIAIARRRTGQTGNVIGNALARSASNFVNRPSSVSVFKQFGLDPNQATTDYTNFVLNAIRKAKDLSGPEIRDLAAALGGPQLGSRIFVGLLRGYALLPQAAKSAGKESAGQLDKELKIKLAQVDEQISRVGHGLERLGAALASAGAFAPLGLALKTLNGILTVANNLTETFAKIPEPFKDIVLYIGEAYLGLKLLRRTGLAGGIASRTGLDVLNYSPKEQIRRDAIVTQRNISAGFGNQAEQLANQSQLAGQNAYVYGQAALAKRQESLDLQARNANQKLVAAADRESIVLADQSLVYSKEALAAKQRYEIVAAAQTEADANLVALQKRDLPPSAIAQRSGGALIVGGPGTNKPGTYTAEELRNVETGTAVAAASNSTTRYKLATANDRLAGAAVGGTRAAEKVAAAAAAAGIATDAQGAAIKVEAGAIVGSGVAMSRLQRSYAILGTGLATARATALTLLSGISKLLFNPLTLALIGFEVIPPLIQKTRANERAANDRLAQLAADTSTQGSLQQRQQFLAANKPKPRGVFGQVIHDLNPFTLDTTQQDKRERSTYDKALADLATRKATQAEALARGTAVPYLTIGQAARRLKSSITSFQRGQISINELDQAYEKAQAEIKSSAEQYVGGAKNLQKVSVALHAARVAILQVAEGTKSIAESLNGASLADLAGALKGESDSIAVFGLQTADLPRIREQYAKAAQLVGQDPSAKNLKNYGIAKQALDAALAEAQTQLQQSLTLATTGPQRDAAYKQFFASIPGVSAIRGRLTEGQQGVAATRARLQQARKAQQELQDRYTRAGVQSVPGLLDPGQRFEQSLGAPSVGQPLGSGHADDQIKKDLDAQKKNVEALGRQIKAQRKGVKNLRDLYERDKKAYEALKREFEQQQAQTENQVAELQAQITAGRTSDPVEAITIQLRAAHRALQNDIRHHVGQEQRLQDELKIQGLQDQQLQAQIQQIQTRTALTTSGIDPINTGAVDRSNLSGLYQELAKARAARPGSVRTEQIQQIQTQINQARFQQAQDVRQQGQAENDAYYGYLEAGQGTLHPLRVAQLEYQKALNALRFAHGKVERLNALANIKSAQEALAEAVHQNAVDDVNAYFGLAESKTTDPLRLAQLEYQKALQLQKKARGPKEKQQTAIDKNNALKTLYQTQADERLKTIEFEASIDKITSDQEIGALKNLLKLKHLTKDFRRQILTQIHQLENQDSSSVELNVGNIRLPTLYDVRRLAAQGTNNQPVIASQTNNITVNGADDPQATAYAVQSVINKHARTHHRAAQRAAGIR